MATIKSFTDLEQSKKLAEFLPLESADICWTKHIDNGDVTSLHATVNYGIVTIDYPCWSLASLIGVLPEIQGGKPIIALDDNYITYPHMSDLHIKADNIVDACVAIIIKLHELNLL